MRFFLEALARELGADARMILRRQADEVLHEQHLLVEARVQLRHEAHGQVDVAVLQPAAAVGGDDLGLDVHARRRVPQVVEQAGQQHHLADVGHADAKAPLRARRLEAAAVALRLRQLRQRLAQVRVDALGVRRGLHALRGAGEQAVVEVRAQLVQRRAGRRLRHAQALGRLGDVAGLVDLVEHGEPFEIELGHGVRRDGALKAKGTIIEISNSVYWHAVLRK
ncbi:hypothetical protein FQZ97_688330 [compost metagenome]